MTDGKVERGRGYSMGCATGEGYSANYLAAKHRISAQQARDLLQEVGPDRERLNLTASAVRRAMQD